MRLSENEVRALILITRSEEPVHPSGLQKELGLLKGSISRIITSLQDILAWWSEREARSC